MKSIQLPLVLIFLVFSISSCNNEPIGEPTFDTIVIRPDTVLYHLLERVANDGDNQEITCIEFVYPLTLHMFDENLEYLNTSYIPSDLAFSDFLSSLDDNQSISISYPITTELSDGSTFTINTNEDLKETIENCIKEEAISNCQEIISTCVWKVMYSGNDENPFVGGIFEDANGATTFNFAGDAQLGSWTPLFIGEELHLNIYMNGADEIASFWNRDWLVTYIESDVINLSAGNQSVILKQLCNTNNPCNDVSLEVQECEISNNPGHAEFVFDSYNSCLLTLIFVDGITGEVNLNVQFFELQQDAELNTNPILASEPYMNIVQGQIVWVRIENQDTLEFIIIPISISAVSC